MSMRERLRVFIAYKGLNARQFERMCGLSNGSMSKMSDKTHSSTVERISRTFPELNIEWLRTGEGKMFSHGHRPSRVARLGEGSVDRSKLIKCFTRVDCSQRGGMFSDMPEASAERMYIPGFTDCQYALPVCGGSTEPVISDGSVLLLSEWKESRIDWGKAYFVCTGEGKCAVARIMPSKDEERVECHSLNPGIPVYELPRGGISALYMVKGWIQRASM